MKFQNLQIKKLKIKKFKKRTLLIFLMVLLVLIALAGIEISKGFLKEAAAEGKKTEAAGEKQNKGTETADASDAGNLEGHLASDFIDILKSGKYRIRYRTTTVYEGKSYEVETIYAVSGSSISLTSGDRATIVKDSKVYMLNHTDKTMLSWAVDHSSDNLKKIDTEGLVYLDSRQEGGLICEEYRTSSANLKLYFKNKVLVRMVTGINGLDNVMDIEEVSKVVSESLFAVPADYKTTNIS